MNKLAYKCTAFMSILKYQHDIKKKHNSHDSIANIPAKYENFEIAKPKIELNNEKCPTKRKTPTRRSVRRLNINGNEGQWATFSVSLTLL